MNCFLSDPKMFEENVTANTFMVDGKIKEVEVTFTVSHKHHVTIVNCNMCVYSLPSCVISRALVM